MLPQQQKGEQSSFYFFLFSFLLSPLLLSLLVFERFLFSRFALRIYVFTRKFSASTLFAQNPCFGNATLIRKKEKKP